jgi:peroxiredoxin
MDRAARLIEEYDSYLAEGAQIVIVGQGEPERAAVYAKKYKLPPVPVLSDPTFMMYQTYGLLEGKPSQIVFNSSEAFQRRDYAVFEQLVKERREADRPLVDNPWQLPGEFVIDKKGVLRLTHRYNYCEDFPNPKVLTAAIREARWETE